MNQNVVFINQSGQQQIITSNQQQGNNVGECEFGGSKNMTTNDLDINLYNFLPALIQQRNMNASQQPMVCENFSSTHGLKVRKYLN